MEGRELVSTKGLDLCKGLKIHIHALMMELARSLFGCLKAFSSIVDILSKFTVRYFETANTQGKQKGGGEHLCNGKQN